MSSRSKPLLEVCHAADHLASLVQTEGHPWSLARAEEALTRLFAPRKVSLEQTLERVAQEVREQSEALDVPIEAQPTFEALLSGASKAVLQINSSYEELTQRLEATLREKDALMRELAQKNLQLQRLASTDVLTGLHNRRAFNEEFARQLQLATGELLTLVLLDIDHFKRINDLHGHPCGDEVLGICGKRLQHAVRRADLVYRIGGEEFAVVFPGANMRQGVEASERLRHILVDTPFGCAGGVRIPVTASFGGVTALPTGEQSEELTAADLLRAADHALYRAKQGGRNQVCWHASLLGGPGPVAG